MRLTKQSGYYVDHASADLFDNPAAFSPLWGHPNPGQVRCPMQYCNDNIHNSQSKSLLARLGSYLGGGAFLQPPCSQGYQSRDWRWNYYQAYRSPGSGCKLVCGKNRLFSRCGTDQTAAAGFKKFQGASEKDHIRELRPLRLLDPGILLQRYSGLGNLMAYVALKVMIGRHLCHYGSPHTKRSNLV